MDCNFCVIFNCAMSYLTNFSMNVLKYQMPYPLGNRASKRISGKRTIREIWDGGGLGGFMEEKEITEDTTAEILSNV